MYLTEQQLFVRHCGQAGMIWCLINHRLKLICKSFTEEHTGFDSGRSYKCIEQTKEISDACRSVEAIAMQIFMYHG
jgi:hypothetical protein